MSFTTPAFVWFFLAFFAVYGGLAWFGPERGSWLRRRWVLVASYLFYASWSVPLTSLLLASTVLDYCVGRVLARTDAPRRRRWLVGLSIVGNLGVLATFKYFDFFVLAAATGLEALGITVSLPTLGLILPVGISFYTFQSMGYAIDVYRRTVAPAQSFADFALYVAYFPQLVAGPIERASRLLPQLQRLGTRASDASGWGLIALGAVKKVVIADNLATFVDPVYGDPTQVWPLALWFATYAFALQIYCDFSGYSDIAIGVARLMGVDLTPNFRAPYAASSPREFWRRWHISLSTWLRDYLYIPLGGSRHGPWRTHVALIATMVLGGLWHGAAANFVLWGLFHGLLLAVFRPAFWGRLWRWIERRLGVVASEIRWLVFFHVVCLGWALFRANSLHDCRVIVGKLLDVRGWEIAAWRAEVTASGEDKLLTLWFVIMLGLVLLQRIDPGGSEAWVARLWRTPLEVRITAVVLALYACIVFAPESPPPFLYFQF